MRRDSGTKSEKCPALGAEGTVLLIFSYCNWGCKVSHILQKADFVRH